MFPAQRGRVCVNWATLSPSSALFPLLSCPQAELSLQKEQLQLKIIEVEDEVDKWQKERDRIKVCLSSAPPPPAITSFCSPLPHPSPSFTPSLPGLHPIPIPNSQPNLGNNNSH